jgi:hypothetical protein
MPPIWERSTAHFCAASLRDYDHAKRVALLAFSDTDVPANTSPDRVIYRNDPRQLPIEINEMLDGRLKLDA